MPTIVTTLTVTCPQIGNVMVTALGESAAVTNVAGTNFNGLAYSISRNSTATDNANIVQSSSLATFNGDANRDFLNVGRVDSCAAGESVTYRLLAYRAQAATGPTSFMYNGRLIGQYLRRWLLGRPSWKREQWAGSVADSAVALPQQRGWRSLFSPPPAPCRRWRRHRNPR